MGTVFLLLKPLAAQTSTTSIEGMPVLVTAAHVLDEMSGDNMEIVMRKHHEVTWIPVSARLAIRRNGQPLWKTVPDADVAVMYVQYPPELPIDGMMPTTLLSDDERLRTAGAGPGIDLKVLGYPLGIQTNGAFPILRTGMIASYPLLPTATTKTFLLDFRVFKGNSGGPVYYSPRVMHGGAEVCCPPKFIMGLVSQEASLTEAYSQLQLSLGIIVHGTLINAAIATLPAPETPEARAAQIPIVLTQLTPAAN